MVSGPSFMPCGLPGLNLLAATEDPKPWRMYHEWYSVPLLLHGSGELMYRGQAIEGRDNLIHVLEPGEVHYNTVVAAPLTFVVAFIPAPVLEGIATELDYVGTPHFRIQGICDHDALMQAFRDFTEAARLGDDPAGAPLSELVGTLLDTLAERRSPEVTIDNSRAVTAVLDAARDGGRCPSIAELARLDRVSERQLHRVFKRSHGVSPVELFQLVRVARFLSLGASGGSVAELAAACGFADQSHLNRVLRRVLRVPAGRYLAEIRDRARVADALDALVGRTG